MLEALFIFLWLLQFLLPLVVGVYLIWKSYGVFRILGCLVLLILAFYYLSWESPYYVIRGGDRVQAFSLNENRFGTNPSLRWMDTPLRLIIVPDSSYVFPQGDRVLVADLEARQIQWQPLTSVSLDDTSTVESLRRVDIEQRGKLSLSYAFPSKTGPRSEISFVGFSLPQWRYALGLDFFGGAYGWQIQRRYFGWVRLAVWESNSGSVVLKLNRIVFNAPFDISSLVAPDQWLPAGKFLIFETYLHAERCVLAVGPFNTSQSTQSKDNNRKQ